MSSGWCCENRRFGFVMVLPSFSPLPGPDEAFG